MPDPRGVIAAYLAGEWPANVALMHLLMELEDPGGLDEVLAGSAAQGSPEQRARLAELSGLAAAHPEAWAGIRAVLREAGHDGPAGSAAEGLARWSAVFDRLAETAPAEAMALYALGSPDLLARATAEIVAALRDWGLLAHLPDVLDLGCGIGRLALALAPEVRSVVGLDLSAGMVARARDRAGGVPNVSFSSTSGRDLAGQLAGQFDLVLASDMFPYLVAAGADLAARHVAEAARVLRPGGALAVLNFSYRGNPARDREDFRAAAAAAGLAVERDGTRDFTLWDGTSFVARKAAGEKAAGEARAPGVDPGPTERHGRDQHGRDP